MVLIILFCVIKLMLLQSASSHSAIETFLYAIMFGFLFSDLYGPCNRERNLERHIILCQTIYTVKTSCKEP